MADDRHEKTPADSKPKEAERQDDRHEKRPEGPYKDPQDEKKQGEVK